MGANGTTHVAVKRSGPARRAAQLLTGAAASKRLVWLAVALTTQLTWGLYPVCTRFLQTRASIPSLQLGVVITLVSWPGILIFCTLPSLLHSCWQRHRAARKTPSLDNGGPQSADIEAPSPCSKDPGAAAAAAPETQQAQMVVKLKQRLKAGGVMGLLGLLVVLYGSVGLLYASFFVAAYIVQLVMLLTPLLTAVGNKLLLGPTPRGLPTSLALSAVGSGLVVAGQWLQDHGSISSCSVRMGLATHFCTLIGLGTAAVSAALCAVYFLMLQVTAAIVTPQQVLLSCRVLGLVVMLPLALAVEGNDWSWVWRLGALGWCVLVFTSIAIFTFGNLGLQHSSRELGAATVANLNCSRVVSCVVLSVLLLHEVPRHALTWVGFCVVTLSLALFMYWQSSPKAVAQHGVGVLARKLSRRLSSPADGKLSTAGSFAASKDDLSSVCSLAHSSTEAAGSSEDLELLWMSGLAGAPVAPPMLALSREHLTQACSNWGKAQSLQPRRLDASRSRARRLHRSITSPASVDLLPAAATAAVSVGECSFGKLV